MDLQSYCLIPYFNPAIIPNKFILGLPSISSFHVIKILSFLSLYSCGLAQQISNRSTFYPSTFRCLLLLRLYFSSYSCHSSQMIHPKHNAIQFSYFSLRCLLFLRLHIRIPQPIYYSNTCHSNDAFELVYLYIYMV